MPLGIEIELVFPSFLSFPNTSPSFSSRVEPSGSPAQLNPRSVVVVLLVLHGSHDERGGGVVRVVQEAKLCHRQRRAHP